MLNHIWTLLLNKSVTSSVTGRIGDMPRSIEYKEVVLSAGLNSIRRILFGTNPDVEFLNYRTKQLITCVINGALEPYAYTFDSRHTYDEAVLDFLPQQNYIPAAKLITGSSLNLNTHGQPISPDLNGIMRHSYTLSSDGINLYLTGLNGLSDLIIGLAANEQKPLGISGYSFSLSNPNAVQTWIIEFMNKPTVSLGTLMANIEKIGEPALLELFNATNEEPYLTFKNIFFNSSDLPLRCAAVALALAYQTEKRRTLS